jgi:hypothetical protein
MVLTIPAHISLSNEQITASPAIVPSCPEADGTKIAMSLDSMKREV